MSRNHTSNRTLKFIKDYENYAREKIADGYDAVIIGHLHLPVLEKIDNGVYLNTGDFISNFSYGRMENGEFTLEYI